MSRSQKTTHHLTVAALLSAVAAVLQFVEFSIPVMPSFIKLDVSDLPALLGTFSLGPVYGVAIQLVKNLLHLPFGSSAGVGELSNFLLGATFAFIAGLIYQHHKSRTGALWARFAELSQIPTGESFDKILLPVERITPEIIETFGERLIGVLPAILWPADEEALEARLAALKETGLREVYGDNIYAIPLTRRRGLTLHGGAGLNILNTEALRHYEEEGLASVTASFELSMRGIKSLGGSIPLGAIVYGRLPLMHFRNCPIRSQLGCAACRARGELTDRRGVKFPVECGEKKYSTLLNSVPLHIADKDLRGLDHCILWFTRESAAECAAVAADYRAGRKSERERTGGLYYRELL